MLDKLLVVPRHFLIISLCGLLAVVWYFIPHPAVIVAVGILPFAILIVLEYPFFMVLLFVIFSFFRIHEVIPQLYNFKIPLLLSLASIASMSWNVFFKKRFSLWWPPEFPSLMTFYVLVSIGVVMASNLPVAMGYYLNIYVKIAIMSFAIAWLITRESEFVIASVAIVIAGWIVGIKALSNKALGIGLVEENRVNIGRVFG